MYRAFFRKEMIPMKCTHCGARLLPGDKVCPECGKRAVGFQEPEAATEAPVNNKPLMIAMIAVLAVLIIVTFLAFSGRLGKKSDADLAVPTPPPAAETAETAVPTATPVPTPTATPSPTPTPVPTETPDLDFLSPAPIPTYGSFILLDSSSRYLTEADLEGLTWEQLSLARNEIFARHGRLFTKPEVRDYFEAQPWYNGAIPASAFTSDMLSSIERANIDLISRVETSLYGGSYY